MVDHVRRTLGLSQRLTLDELAVKLGVTSVKGQIRQLLTAYTARHHLASSDSCRPVLLCAAVAVVCGRAKPKVKYSKSALQHLSSSSKRELEATVHAMNDLLEAKEEADRDDSAIEPPPSKRRKLNGGVEEERPDQLQEVEEEDEEENAFSLSGYYEWRSRMLKMAGIKEP